MKRMVTKQILETYCDICSELCHNSTTITVGNKEHHACHQYNEARGETHAETLRKRIANGINLNKSHNKY